MWHLVQRLKMYLRLNKKRRKLVVFLLPILALTHLVSFFVLRQPATLNQSVENGLYEAVVEQSQNVGKSDFDMKTETGDEGLWRRQHLQGKVSSLMEQVLEPIMKAAQEPHENKEQIDSRRRKIKRKGQPAIPLPSVAEDTGDVDDGENFYEFKRRNAPQVNLPNESVVPIEKSEKSKNDELLPVQENPWVDVDDEGDPLQAYQHQRAIAPGSGCAFRQFENHTVYSKPEFAGEYTKYKECSVKARKDETSLMDAWLNSKISAHTGKWGELILKLSFRYPVDSSSVLLCASPDGSDAPTMLYLVMSRRNGRDRRDTIRRTWGESLPSGHRVVFFVGDGPENVSEESSDLVSTEVTEDESQFDMKFLTAALAWVYQRCELTRFVAVVTDATFVNVQRFRMFASMEMNSANRLYGTMLKRMEPDRNPRGKHHVTEEEWPWKYFPPFLQEPSFIISGDVIPRILVGSKILHYLPGLHQVFLTGLVPLLNRVMRIGVAEFFHPQLDNMDDDECQWAKHGVIEGIIDSKTMEEVYLQVDNLQRVRNVTCTIHTSCSVRIDGKCMIKSATDGKTKKGHKTKNKTVP